jgi:predicted SAM-dependent methyltransferase
VTTHRPQPPPAGTVPSPGAHREPAPLIVFGAPRSGTTYLQRILDLHPDIFVTHETRVFAWLHAAICSLPIQDQFVVTERKRFVEYLSASLPDLMREFYRQLNPDTRYWGDKNPHYADPANLGCLALIAELFPGAKFVNIIRDGRDVVASLLRRTNAEGQPWVDFEAAHRTWITHVEVGRGFGRRQSEDTYYEIRYEDLVRDDVKHAGELCSFLDLDLPLDVEAYCAAQASERTPLSNPTRTAIGDVNSSDWSAVLSPDEQLRSLALLGSHLVHLGYETQESLEVLGAAITTEQRTAVRRVSPGGSSTSSPPASCAGVRRLNWGCGAAGEPGWINSDVKEGSSIDISADIRDGLPIESGSLDYIVSIHALPMIHFHDLVPVLAELRRMLKPGGVLRLGLPDVDRAIRAYLEADRSYFAVGDDHARSMCGKFALHTLWYGHSVTMFNAEFAAELLESAGFVRVAHCGFRESAAGLEGITDLDNREQESFFIEAVEPTTVS